MWCEFRKLQLTVCEQRGILTYPDSEGGPLKGRLGGSNVLERSSTLSSSDDRSLASGLEAGPDSPGKARGRPHASVLEEAGKHLGGGDGGKYEVSWVGLS